MKLYTYKPDFIVQEYEYWTGHIDSYFNKRFILKNIKPLIVPVDEKIADIIDQANDIDFIVLNKIGNKILWQYINKNTWKEECYNSKYTKEERNDLESKLLVDYSLKEFNKLTNLLQKTYNTLYEFIDEANQRSFVDIMNCQFKKFENNDIQIYNKLASEAESYNIFTNSQIYEYLFSINAYEDYIKYHKGEDLKFRLIGNSVNKIINSKIV